jgi:TolB-like protein
MYPKSKRNAYGACLAVFAWLLLSWTIPVPPASAQTYDFDDGMKTLTSELLAKKEGVLKAVKIAVFGIVEGNTGEKWRITMYIEDDIVDALVDEGYTVVERSRVDDVLKEEMKKGADLWFDEAKAAQVGKLLGADAVVTGRYTHWGNNILRINIRCISVADGRVLAASKINVHTDRLEGLLRGDEPKTDASKKGAPVWETVEKTSEKETTTSDAKGKPVQDLSGKTEVKVSSNVKGAQVWVDGKEVKQVPVTLTHLNPGPHTVLIGKDGYEPYEEKVMVIRGASLEVHAVLQAAARTGAIQVTGKPEGAKVYLNGYYVGTVPVELQDIEPGTYKIKIVQDGYAAWERSLDVKPGKKASADATLLAVKPDGNGVPVTIYWHMADDADLYLNGSPLRNYEPSFRTRGDEAPLPAFKAETVLKDGDVFTVGGRRGGSYGFMLIAVERTGRVVFKTDQKSWKVYAPGDRPDWHQPSVAAISQQFPVIVQPDPWFPQKDLNRKFGDIAHSIWSSPSDRFAFLTAKVNLAKVEPIPSPPIPAPSSGLPVTIYWHMADDADLYLNGLPLRKYEPSFRTRGDEAPLAAFYAAAVLKNGDVFTVGGRRGGSYGFMLIAVDHAGRVVFRTNKDSWKVYFPGDRPDWYQPSVAANSPRSPVTVQPNPWPPQKDLNNKFGNAAHSVWSVPSDRFAFLTAKVQLE